MNRLLLLASLVLFPILRHSARQMKRWMKRLKTLLLLTIKQQMPGRERRFSRPTYLRHSAVHHLFLSEIVGDLTKSKAVVTSLAQQVTSMC